MTSDPVKAADAAVYAGNVVHMRLRPKQHRLSYGVFSLLTDVDRLPETARGLRLFSYNRANVFAIHDRDHGPGDGTPLGVHTRAALTQAGLAEHGARILMLAYPRMFGSVFNPLTVYYCFGASGALGALIYEVDNTVGERTSYVLPAGEPVGNEPSARVFAQACPKQMYVSPFTPAAGRYGFRVIEPGRSVLVGVHLADSQGALVRTHFHGEAEPFDDRTLASLIWRFPLLTLRIAGAIHVEALKLYMKGVPLVRRHVSPRYSVAVMPRADARKVIGEQVQSLPRARIYRN